jgi:hypothetical protein
MQFRVAGMATPKCTDDTLNELSSESYKLVHQSRLIDVDLLQDRPCISMQILIAAADHHLMAG